MPSLCTAIHNDAKYGTERAELGFGSGVGARPVSHARFGLGGTRTMPPHLHAPAHFVSPHRLLPEFVFLVRALLAVAAHHHGGELLLGEFAARYVHVTLSPPLHDRR
jgi:hypothetical protein